MYLDGKLQGIKEGSYVNSDRTIVYNQLGSGLCDRWKNVVWCCTGWYHLLVRE
jgi:hypothetical protein